MAAGRHIVEPVDVCIQQMVHSVLPGSGIQRIAVCQKRKTALFFHDVSDCFCVVRPEKGEIAQFPEMQFDRDKLAFKVNTFHACPPAEFLQLRTLGNSDTGSEIGKENFGFFHAAHSSSFMLVPVLFGFSVPHHMKKPILSNIIAFINAMF